MLVKDEGGEKEMQLSLCSGEDLVLSCCRGRQVEHHSDAILAGVTALNALPLYLKQTQAMHPQKMSKFKKGGILRGDF